MTTTSAHLHGAAHGAYSRLTIQRFGLGLFIASESFLFLVLISTRFALLGLSRPDDLNLTLGIGVTMILLSSSFTGYRSMRAIRTDDQRGLTRWLLVTLALGILFLAGLSLEWAEGLAAFPPSNPYGTAFFSLTGMHGLHVLSGLVIVGLVYLRARAGGYTSGSHWGVEAGIRYWTFVDAVWLFIFPTLYLL